MSPSFRKTRSTSDAEPRSALAPSAAATISSFIFRRPEIFGGDKAGGSLVVQFSRANLLCTRWKLHARIPDPRCPQAIDAQTQCVRLKTEQWAVPLSYAGPLPSCESGKCFNSLAATLVLAHPLPIRLEARSARSAVRVKRRVKTRDTLNAQQDPGGRRATDRP